VLATAVIIDKMNLTEELQKLIDKRADKKVAEIKGNIQEYKDWVDGLDETLSFMLQNAKDMIKDSKEEGLTVNAIEAEGFLRGVITVKNQIDSDKRWISE